MIGAFDSLYASVVRRARRNPLAGVTRDALSGKYVPNTASECAKWLAAAGITTGNPFALWRFQEAGGNPSDSIGAFTLTASGTPAYQQAVTGWSRKAIAFTDGSSGALSSTSVSLPNIGTTSFLVLAYVKYPASNPAGARGVVSLGVNATRTAVEIANTGAERINTDGTVLNGSAACTGVVRPVMIMVDRTHSVAAMSTDLDNLMPTFNAGTAGQGLFFGTTSNFAAAEGYLWGVAFSGTAAEWSTSQRRAAIQTLGWTIPW